MEIPAHLLVVTGFVVVTSVSFPQQFDMNLVVRNYSADHFSISVPADWVEIEKGALDELTASLRKVAPQTELQAFTYGFQSSRRAPYARVLVQVKRNGRLSEEFSEGLERVIPEVESKLRSANPALAAMNLHLGKLTWDSKSQIAWLHGQSQMKDGQRVMSLSGVHPMEVGSIQVTCNANESNFNKVAAIFTEIITSVKIDEQVRYRERSKLSRAYDAIGPPAAVGVVVCSAVVWLVGIRRRRKTATPKPAWSAAWKFPVGALLLLGSNGV